jgi:ParB family transcriptional regulator, chromosome partitioning protein
MAPTAARKKGLGRGLASLIPDTAFDAEATGPIGQGLRQVPLDEIRPNPEQPRTRFDASALEALADSIREHGVLSPLVVHRHEGAYVLLAGERRLRAAGLAGLHEVPCVVVDADSPDAWLELALIENLQREDLDPVEAARGYDRLIRVFGRTQVQVARAVGRDRSTIANAVRLLGLPDAVLARVQDGTLSAGHGRALLPLKDRPAELHRLARQVEAQGWSVRRTEREVARRLRPERPPAPPDTTFDYATRLLTDALRTSVSIQGRRDGSGRIVLDYADAEDLERLIDQLKGTAG